MIAIAKLLANSGTIPRIPRRITLSVATIEVAAVAVTAASIARPDAKNCNPAPAARQPIPIKPTAAPRAIIDGTIGARIVPAAGAAVVPEPSSPL